MKPAKVCLDTFRVHRANVLLCSRGFAALDHRVERARAADDRTATRSGELSTLLNGDHALRLDFQQALTAIKLAAAVLRMGGRRSEAIDIFERGCAEAGEVLGHGRSSLTRCNATGYNAALCRSTGATMPVPDLTHLQFLVLQTIGAVERSGRHIREKLADEGQRKSLPAFYQMMARLEEGGFIKPSTRQIEIDGQKVNERWYKVTGAGLKAVAEVREFYSRRDLNALAGKGGAANV
jgi:DNA-binding PadR family transcriptional regulator